MYATALPAFIVFSSILYVNCQLGMLGPMGMGMGMGMGGLGMGGLGMAGRGFGRGLGMGGLGMGGLGMGGLGMGGLGMGGLGMGGLGMGLGMGMTPREQRRLRRRGIRQTRQFPVNDNILDTRSSSVISGPAGFATLDDFEPIGLLGRRGRLDRRRVLDVDNDPILDLIPEDDVEDELYDNDLFDDEIINELDDDFVGDANELADVANELADDENELADAPAVVTPPTVVGAGRRHGRRLHRGRNSRFLGRRRDLLDGRPIEEIVDENLVDPRQTQRRRRRNRGNHLLPGAGFGGPGFGGPGFGGPGFGGPGFGGQGFGRQGFGRQGLGPRNRGSRHHGRGRLGSHNNRNTLSELL